MPLVLGGTVVVGVVVGVGIGAVGAFALLAGAVYLVSVVLYIVPAQRQITVTDELVEVRRTPAAKPEARSAPSALVLERRGALFSWWRIGDRRYSTPTARAGALFELVEVPS